MNGSIYVVGDLHIRSEEPFFSAAKNVLSSIYGMLTPGDAVVFTGDVFHRARPFPNEYAVARQFFEDCRNNNVAVYVLAGNHEYIRDRDEFAEDAFLRYSGTNDTCNEPLIDFITEPCVKEINGEDFLFLPHIPPYRAKRDYGCQSLNEVYDKIALPKFKGIEAWCVYHFEDETCWLGPNHFGVDLKMLGSGIKRLGGHIHVSNKNYIGTPYATRLDENEQLPKIVRITNGVRSEILLDKTIKYMTVAQESLQGIRWSSKMNYILTVTNVTDTESMHEFITDRSNMFLRDFSMEYEEREVSEDSVDMDGSNGLLEYLAEYCTQNKVSTATSEYLFNKVSGN